MRSLAALRLFTLLAAVAASACAGAPVQEMSNARQTIRAAQDAGAAQYAPDPLNEAQNLLSQAETALHRHEYRNARNHAMAAHDKAAEALHEAEAHR
jgi:hypothetical protein